MAVPWVLSINPELFLEPAHHSCLSASSDPILAVCPQQYTNVIGCVDSIASF